MIYPVLIIEDDRNLREIISDYLSDRGFYVLSTDSAEKGYEMLKGDYIPVVILDLFLPGMDGFELMRKWRKNGKYDVMFIVITAQTMTRNAIQAMKEGAFEYLIKPFELEELEIAVNRAINSIQDKESLQILSKEINSLYSHDDLLIGRSSPMQEVYKLIGRVADTDVTVLIEGESGTGKELVAKTIHFNSKRFARPFIPINMAAIPSELLEGELFGYEEGAFTGATRKYPGKFLLANGGTIFLDEIGEAPLTFQAKLLRFLEDKMVMPLGGSTQVQLDVRIIAATNRDLEEMVERGEFREDLYYRLKVFSIKLPPLRERIEDIPLLIKHFLLKFKKIHGIEEKEFTDEAIELLKHYSWPGNVRELENTILRIIITAPGKVITPEDVKKFIKSDMSTRERSLSEVVYEYLREIFDSFEMNSSGKMNIYHEVIKRVEEPLLRLALEKTRWNQVKAAELLGINRNTLRKKMKELGIDGEKRNS